MERIDGFNFDDVAGMKGAGVDTEAVVRTAMIALIEGAMVYGVFHGDLHGGNLFVLPDGRTALLDFGIVGRLSSDRRLAFLRMMVCATTNDVKGQLAAMRDLGALPVDVDLKMVMHDLRLDQAPIDPTTLTGEELVAEVQRVVKALLGYGARMPKELMLYVKNMVFLDGAMARLAPDLDLLAEIANISMMFAERHGEQLGRELGIDQSTLGDQHGRRQGRLRCRCLDRAADLSRVAISSGTDPEADARPRRGAESSSLGSRREPRRERQPLLGLRRSVRHRSAGAADRARRRHHHATQVGGPTVVVDLGCGTGLVDPVGSELGVRGHRCRAQRRHACPGRRGLRARQRSIRRRLVERHRTARWMRRRRAGRSGSALDGADRHVRRGRPPAAAGRCLRRARL